MLPFPAVNFLHIPWDFALILIFLGVLVPWRGAARMKRLMSKSDLTTADRLSLYRSTIFFQWLIVIIVGWRCVAETVAPKELGLAIVEPWRVAWTSIALTGIYSLNQVAGLSRIMKMPEGQRGLLFAITQRIMPATRKETWVYATLACTAGLSEEFLFRGFVFMTFARMAMNYEWPNAFAAILSSVWFSLAHLYQGKRGIITTFVVGMIFAAVRIWTGSLIPVVTAHIAIDLVAGLIVYKTRRGA